MKDVVRLDAIVVTNLDLIVDEKASLREQLIGHFLDEVAEKLVRDGCPP